MTVDLKPEADGRFHFSLGPVERWVVTLCALALLGGSTMLYRKMDAQLEAVTSKLSSMTVQQAVANDRLAQLTAQLSDVPAMKGQVAELKVRTDRLEQDVKELRSLR